jgi:hypothetical protein
MKKRFPALLLLSAQLFAQPAHAWDAVGHQVIARIAWENMTPRTRTAAVALLSNAPTDSDLRLFYPSVGPNPIRDRTLFVRASTWADVVRATNRPERMRKYHRSTWHFINYFFEGTGPAMRDRPDLRPDTTNVVEALGSLESSLLDLRRPSSQRAIDLAWTLHLVGDIHQPLHTTAQVTASAPRGDQGGNLFLLDGQNNLHGYWDGLVWQSLGRLPGEADPEYVDRVALALAQRHPRAGFAAALNDRDYASWARDGFQIAKTQVYSTAPERRPDEAYRTASIRAAENAAALAGYRLAELLNRTMGGGSGNS